LELEVVSTSDARRDSTLEVEACAIGSALLDADAALHLRGVPVEAFYSPAHQVLARHCNEISRNGVLDFVTLRASLSASGDIGAVGGIEYAIQVAQMVPSARNARVYCDGVLASYQRRRLRELCHEISGQAYDLDGAGMASKLHEAAREILSYQPADGEVLGAPIPARVASSGVVTSGFRCVDSTKSRGGLGRRQTHLVMADSNGGKSSMLTQMMLAHCYRDEFARAVVVSTEMTRQEIREKALRQLTGWDSAPTKSLDLARKFRDAEESLAAMNVVFLGMDELASHEVAIEYVVAWVQAQHEKNPLDAVYLDGFQLYRTKTREKEYRMHELVSAEMLQLATRLDVAVVVSSQVTEGERRREPKGSRRPFEDASTVLDIRYDAKTQTRTVRKVKDRFGHAPLDLDLTWNPERVRFDEEEA